jgi:hypothetical protein
VLKTYCGVSVVAMSAVDPDPSGPGALFNGLGHGPPEHNCPVVRSVHTSTGPGTLEWW